MHCREPARSMAMKHSIFNSVYNQVEVYGEVVDKQDEAATEITDLPDRVETAKAQIPDDEQRTAAVLCPTINGRAAYAYGTSSGAHPQLETAGFTNVFEDTSERVFGISSEQLMGLDIIILLHYEGEPEAIEDTLRKPAQGRDPDRRAKRPDHAPTAELSPNRPPRWRSPV